MRICYVDESGDTGMLETPASNVQPVFVLSGVVVDAAVVPALTRQFVALKQRFFPGLKPRGRNHQLDWILAEVKGADVRRAASAPGRNERRQAFVFLDRVMALLESCEARVFGRVWIKQIGVPVNGKSVYTFSIQEVFSTFHSLLVSANDTGLVIADSRTKPSNSAVAHSIFTQKFRVGGDPFDRILEMPTYGHSENHAGLQIADLLCSGLLCPIAIHAYCAGYVSNVHVRPHYFRLRDRFGVRMKDLQHRYVRNGKAAGGIVVSDPLGHRSGKILFEKPVVESTVALPGVAPVPTPTPSTTDETPST